MSRLCLGGDPARVIQGVIVHLENDLPILVYVEELPGPADQMVRCTNVRTIDGKRPAFVHDRHSTFLLPLKMIRLLEVPTLSNHSAVATQDDEDIRTQTQQHEAEPEVEGMDEEAEEDFLARIRSI